MMIFLILSALAEEVPSTIVALPEGTMITLPESEIQLRVVGQSYLLPESHYETALVKAKRLLYLEPAFEECSKLSESWSSLTTDSINACSEQTSADESVLLNLQSSLKIQEDRAIVAELRVQKLRSQRNTAWSIAGGLILGSVAVTAIALGG